MEIKRKINTWKEVFDKPKYLLLAIVIAIVFYEINVLIASWATLSAVYSSVGFFSSLRMLFNLSLGFGKTILWHSYASVILISISLGMLFSLIAYRTTMSVKTADITKKGTGIFATAGIFLGILVPGCAACGVGILSALGLGVVAVNFLPFEGLEISLLSIFLLVYSISKITDKISNGNSCSIESRSPISFTQLKGGKNE